MGIEEGRLPQNPMLDTGVIIRALRRTHPNEESKMCAVLWGALVARRKRILIAAPSLAEVFRGHTVEPVPRRHGIEVVAFDTEAATLLGEKLPHAAVVEGAAEGTRRCLRFDALIVACAARYHADVLITVEGHMTRLAAMAGVEVAHPRDYMDAQAPFETADGPWTE